MKVLVVTDGVYFKAFCKNKRLRKTPLPSNSEPNDNPYHTYGKLLSIWLDIDKFDLTITVATVTSGEL